MSWLVMIGINVAKVQDYVKACYVNKIQYQREINPLR